MVNGETNSSIESRDRCNGLTVTFGRGLFCKHELAGTHGVLISGRERRGSAEQVTLSINAAMNRRQYEAAFVALPRAVSEVRTIRSTCWVSSRKAGFSCSSARRRCGP